MPNQHSKSKLMRVPLETAARIETIAQDERRAANAQLAVIVDEWCAMKGYAVDASRVHEPAPRGAPPRPRQAGPSSVSR